MFNINFLSDPGVQEDDSDIFLSFIEKKNNFKNAKSIDSSEKLNSKSKKRFKGLPYNIVLFLLFSLTIVFFYLKLPLSFSVNNTAYQNLNADQVLDKVLNIILKS